MYSDGVYSGHKSGFLKYFDSVLNALRKKLNVEEIWIGAIMGSISKSDEGKIKYYNAFSFRDGNEMLEKLEPDLIMIPNSQEYLSRSLLLAAKFRQIPSVILYSGPPSSLKTNVLKTIIIRLIQLRSFGRMFFKKYVFLIKTLFGIGYSWLYIIKITVKDIYLLLTSLVTEFKSDEADLYICSNLAWEQYAVSSGINTNKLVVVGEYAMDHVYEKMSHLSKSKSDKTEVLLITSAVVEHGIWKPSMHEEVVTRIVKALKEQVWDIINLKVKIHPTSERLEDYRQMINPIDPTIEIIQKGDLLSLINQSDLIVTYAQSTALLEVLLLNKPIIMMNMLNETVPYIEEKVVIECTDTNMLAHKIRDGSYSEIDKDRIQEFVKKQLYKFDGKCGERAADHIVSLLTRYKRT